jgi:hypothetical protein
MAMGVHVDSPNALSIDNHFATPLRRLRQRGSRQTASDKRETRQRAGSTAEHFSAVCHHLRFPLPTDIPGCFSCSNNSGQRCRGSMAWP